MRRRPLSAALAGLLALSLAGCATAPEEPPGRPPAVRPEPPPAPSPNAEEPEPAAIPSAPSPESQALALYYRRLQADLLAQGLLRGDGGGSDTPYTDTMLARNFVEIALFDEYASAGGTLVAERSAARLRRWEQPIRMEIEFGPSVEPSQRVLDRASVLAYAARLSRLTSVPIAQVEEDANFHVLFLSEDDREAFESRLRDLAPGIAESSVRAFMNLPRSTLCLVFAFGSGDGSGYSKAVALVRAEHPELLRTACIHEELAQGMGLANDSPNARPSIFNDDEEFGRLTAHDELLLRMLYDPRLNSGMTAEEATPAVQQIAAELVGGPV
ncbi:DUF2927 domain-containing protein [Rubellimicrobium roseum]|uniref:DUF2927 domain-containing protein n=1 Tax=Rubellimicrobium roseum TaxID=687525 RepID=A0A5C4NEK3_9RHOB|nr:DUF2927 domain-containing protein [Rubellimicrobium roseum]